MDTFTPFVIGLGGVGVATFVGWTIVSIIQAKADIAAVRLHVAEEYLKNGSLAELKNDIHALRDLVYKIAIKMEVPVFSEKF